MASTWFPFGLPILTPSEPPYGLSYRPPSRRPFGHPYDLPSGPPSGVPSGSPSGPPIDPWTEAQVGTKSHHDLTTHWMPPGLAWRIQKIRTPKILGTKMVPILGTKMVPKMGTKMVPALRPCEPARTDARREPFWFPKWEPFWFLKWEPFWAPEFSKF